MFIHHFSRIGLLFILYIISLSARFTIKRSTIIKAKPAMIFLYVNDLHKFLKLVSLMQTRLNHAENM